MHAVFSRVVDEVVRTELAGERLFVATAYGVAGVGVNGARFDLEVFIICSRRNFGFEAIR
jgi:hypothetical protein